MTVFISGGAKCGKSSFAQDLTVALAGNGKRYYVATMIPTGEEDFNRIRRHIADRDGMGFETVECFRNILDCLQTADKNGVFRNGGVLQRYHGCCETPWNLPGGQCYVSGSELSVSCG